MCQNTIINKSWIFITESIWSLLKEYGRVAICGQIAVYNLKEVPKTNDFLMQLVYKKINVRGFGFTEFLENEIGYAEECNNNLAKWVKKGQLKVKETVMEVLFEK